MPPSWLNICSYPVGAGTGWLAGPTDSPAQSVLLISRADLQTPPSSLLYRHRRKDSRLLREGAHSLWIRLPGPVLGWCPELSRSSVTTANEARRRSWRAFLRLCRCCLSLGTTPPWSCHFGSGRGESSLASDCKTPCSHPLHRQKRGEETDGGAVCPRPNRRSAGEAGVEQTSLCPATMIHLLSPRPSRALLSRFKV